MKIGILTHYDVHNHGALLQLNALIQVIKCKGFDVAALTYKKNYDFMAEGIDKKYDISIRSVLWYLSYMCSIGLKRTLFNVRKKRILDKFRKPLEGEYYSRAKDLFAVVIGSDEVFSVETGINPFFFGHGIPCDKICSYAACCGPTTLDAIKDKNLEGFVHSGLENMKKISVRDENTKNIVFELTQNTVPVVCDPVILYGYKDEIRDAENKFNSNYILIYSYDNNMNDDIEVKKIRHFASKNHLKIISAGFYHKWCDKCVDASPTELLSYFKNADYVITDTFHGAVMSLICNSQFVAKLRNNANKLYDLLSRYGVADRIVNDFDEITGVFSKNIDYSIVNNLIEAHRNESAKFIDDFLGIKND